VTLSEILYPVSVADFLTEYYNVRPLHAPGPAARFSTLAARAEEEASLDLAALTHSLELDLEAPVRAMPRAGGQGLPLHRGERDLMVFQTAGLDLWRLHGREAEYPSAESTWQAELHDGSTLYIPRGWWYSAEPLFTPSLNVTLHIENPTGADLLLWLAEKMQGSEAFGADIPRFAGPAAKSDYLIAMRQAIVQAFRMPDLLERYAQRLNSRAPVTRAPEMSWSETEFRGRSIAIAAPRRPQIRRRDKETIFIRVGGLDFSFPVDAAPLFTFLLDKAPVAAAEFYSVFEGEFDHDEISEFLTVLHKAGIVTPADTRPAS
jgi:Cupin superfamily protein